MSIFMQAVIEAHTGKLPKLQETLLRIFPIMEGQGWKLHGCFVHQTGRIHTVTDFWELEDMEHVRRARAGLAQHPDYPEIRVALAECIANETLTFMERFR